MAKDNDQNTVELPYEAIEIIDLAKNMQKTLDGLAKKEHTHDGYATKEHSHEHLEKAVAALDKDLAAERLDSMTVVMDEGGLNVDELEVSERTRRFILRTGDSPVRITDLIRGTKTARYFDEPSRIVPADTRFTVSVTVTNALGKDPAAFIQYGCAFLNGPIA